MVPEFLRELVAQCLVDGNTLDIEARARLVRDLHPSVVIFYSYCAR